MTEYDRTEMSPSPGLASLPKETRRSITFHLIHADEMTTCPFWIGLFQKGTVTPSSLFECKNLFEVFERAARDGLSEAQPVMMSDTSFLPVRFMYLLPEPGRDFMRKAEWIKNLQITAQAWQTSKIGIYMDPILIGQKQMQELLQQILLEMAQNNSATEDYYLVTHTHGLNAALNAALSIKSELSEQFDVMVFH